MGVLSCPALSCVCLLCHSESGRHLLADPVSYWGSWRDSLSGLLSMAQIELLHYSCLQAMRSHSLSF